MLENSRVEPRNVTPVVSGKESFAAPSESKGEATEQGPVMSALTNYHVIFLWKLDKQHASLWLFHSISKVEGRVP